MPLPDSIVLTQEREVTRLVLPVRVRSGSKAVGLVPIAFGLIFAGFALAFMASALGFLGSSDMDEEPLPEVVAVEGPASGPEAPVKVPEKKAQVPVRHFDGSNVLGALFGLPFLIVGMIPIGLGILSFFSSHSEIVLDSGELVSLERIGPFRVRQRRAIAQISAIRVGRSFETSQSAANSGLFIKSEAVPRELRMAQRYPLDLVTPVADFLLGELRRRGAASLAADIVPPPPAEMPTPQPVPQAGLVQPEGSRISCVATPESITLLIPHSGFRGTAKVFMIFALFWNGLSVPFFAMVLVQLIHEPSIENLGIVCFLSLFVAIGTAFFLAAIQSAFRKAVLLSTKEVLVFTQTGPLRKSEKQWAAGELGSIVCNNSNTSVNGQPLKQLAITTKGSEARMQVMLGGRDEAELQWIASMLHDFYGLPRPEVKPD